MAKKIERTTWKWQPDQLDFLRANASLSGKDLVAAFRKAFPSFKGSDQSVKGRRYTILNRTQTPEDLVAALEARLIGAREQVDQLEHELVEARRQASEVAGPEFESMRKAELLRVAEERGLAVPKSANKARIVKALAA